MTESRPVIFISAVSRELRSTRDLVAKTLLLIGYEPKWQDIAPTETGDLHAVLRKRVDDSHAVLQIVGHCYGYGSKEADPNFGPVSYTQYEAFYARARGKKVWYILLGDHHPVDCPNDEPADLKNLQADYRTQVRAHHGLYHKSDALLSTENIVLKLRDDLAKLHLRSKQWAAITLFLLLSLAAGVTWSIYKQSHAGEKLTNLEVRTEVAAERHQKEAESLQEIKELGQKTYAALLAFPAAVNEAKQIAPEEDEAARTARAYEALEKSLKLPSGTLAKELPALSDKLLKRTDTSELDRARAYFAIKQYADAEASALRAKDAALAANPISIPDVIVALRAAGQSASEQAQYKRALDHYRAAAALTSEERDVLAWAEIQCEIGWLLSSDGQYDAQGCLMHRVWQACEKAGHSEHASTLHSHHLWACALESQGKSAEAEVEHRAVLAVELRLQGPEHPNTLSSRTNLAVALNSLGKSSEAEAEHRAVLAIRERVLGSEHPSTLSSMIGLANALSSQGRHAEAEKAYWAVLAIDERIFGLEHPETMGNRGNLANALSCQGKYAEAEKEYRAVLAYQERVLAPGHPDTLACRNNLANALNSQGEYTVSEKEYRAVLAIQERVLGLEHPDTLCSRSNLAEALYRQGKYTEAETVNRAVLAIRLRKFGPEHHDTLESRTALANLLWSQGDYAGAEAEHRAVLAIRERVLRENHPDVFTSCYDLSFTLAKRGQFPEALVYARRAFVGRNKAMGQDHLESRRSKRLVEDLERELARKRMEF